VWSTTSQRISRAAVDFSKRVKDWTDDENAIREAIGALGILLRATCKEVT
jgi:hypothetical protein